MIDLKILRTDPDSVKEALKKRNMDLTIFNYLITLEQKRREAINNSESKKAERNSISSQIAAARKNKENGKALELQKKAKEISNEVKILDEETKKINEDLMSKLLYIPNFPSENSPVGIDENDNKVVKKWGEPRNFDFEPLAHWDLGLNIDSMDFERASKLSGSRFTILKKQLAKLERVLVNFMLKVHTEENDYIEFALPYMVKRDIMTACGQLPKFEDEAYKTTDDMFLIPTAEVPLVSLHKNEIIEFNDLPLKYTGYTPCFRREAGSYGKDVKGMIRVHQFDKVELVWITKPENSDKALEELTLNAESILQKLNLPYRVVNLCTGDLGFNAAQTYDIEVWLPSQDKYREISSCSNVKDFQGRRENIRFRDKDNELKFVHTLNGSGLAVGRTLIAIMENYQTEDGKIKVPEILQNEMGVEYIG
ncbi:MAG: seryl-tRNA synthetase [Kosmotogales bacterium]|nr:seryl-tRNA synthetase [Kosmotogales bacterium]